MYFILSHACTSHVYDHKSFSQIRASRRDQWYLPLFDIQGAKANRPALELPPDDPEADERCRSIERGGRIVTAVPTTFSVILQMPRGNLETIFPRAMVIAGIRRLVEEQKYRQAFVTCRTQRVDMNILYDHAPEQFLSNIPLFISQLHKVSYIDLFLSSLRYDLDVIVI